MNVVDLGGRGGVRSRFDVVLLWVASLRSLYAMFYTLHWTGGCQSGRKKRSGNDAFSDFNEVSEKPEAGRVILIFISCF